MTKREFVAEDETVIRIDDGIIDYFYPGDGRKGKRIQGRDVRVALDQNRGDMKTNDSRGVP